MLRRTVIASIVAFALSPIAAAVAIAPVGFDDAAFTAAQTGNKTILVQVHADWCPHCAAQRPILAKALASDKYKDVVTFNIDWDTQKDLVRKFNAQRQSTLIVFKGTRETGRSVGATQEGPILDLLATGL
jgi:thiol-disulfide isomerase/thioredoxin